MNGRTSASAIPLEAGVKSSYFKLLFLDIGLLHSISGLYPKTMMVSDLNTVYMGGVSEQFVGQDEEHGYIHGAVQIGKRL